MSDMKKFEKLLRLHGIRVTHGKPGGGKGSGTGHRWLVRESDGRHIYTMSNSAKIQHFAISNTIKDLINAGHLPAGIVWRGTVYKAKLKKDP